MPVRHLVHSSSAAIAVLALACFAVPSVARAADFAVAPPHSRASERKLEPLPLPLPRDHGSTSQPSIAHAAKGAPSVQFTSDFGSSCDTPTAPVGFVVHDLDGHTPDPSITPQSSAWTVFRDYRHAGDCVAMSVSYFTPAGAANDWLVIAAPLTPDAGTLLRWNAVAYYAGFPDGYEVRYSTAGSAPANFLANPPLLTVAAENPTWTSHELSLAALAGTPIRIAFRNPSNDKYLLALDDIYVGPRPAVDPAVDMVVDAFGDYAVVPDFLHVPYELSAVVRNVGTQALTNVVAQAQLSVADAPTDAFTASPIAALAPGDDATVLLGAGTFDTVGDWTLDTHVSAGGTTDGDPGNATRADRLMTVSASELRYADRRGEASITQLSDDMYGQDFVLPTAAQLTGVTMLLVDNGSGRANLNLYAELYRWNEQTRQLGEMVNYFAAEPEVVGGIMHVTLEPAWTPMLLPAGHYMFLTEQTNDYRLLLRNSRILTSTNWKADYTESGLALYTLEESYPDALGLTWDFTLLLAAPAPFADGFE